ncbi:response regulator transcription factor [Mycobacterium sp. Dal123C01]|uniref:response regulator transcription factor n=1 Tax=Mycobacterium sp. Dal123C01 TaxID=3457577 RepID=UPI00403EA050
MITEFRTASSAQALVQQAPEAIAQLGFDRVLLSRIDQDVWLPESMFVHRDPQWAAAILEAGRAEPTTLDAVVETDVAKTGCSLVVDEVQTHPRVCRPIAAASRADNYGVVPIVVEKTVIGMVHVDCYLQQRSVRRTQCDLLALAVETLAAHLSRLLLLDQLQAIRQAPGRLWSTPIPASTPPPPRPDPSLELTERELDVVRLMAAGETNYRISRLLDIAESTAKTHVSNILRKLDASNRAQAVSRWLTR